MQTKPTKGLTAAIVLSVNTSLTRKQKAHIYHINFEIATFLKTGVYIYIYIYIYAVIHKLKD